MRTQDFQGLKIYRIPAEAKRTRKDGTPRDPKKIGKIHFPVFTPDGTRVVGFMVSPPDVAGMIKQSDRFVARDVVRVYEGVLAVPDAKDSFDAAAAKRLGIDLERLHHLDGYGRRDGFRQEARILRRCGVRP